MIQSKTNLLLIYDILEGSTEISGYTAKFRDHVLLKVSQATQLFK